MKTYRGSESQFNRYFILLCTLFALAFAANGFILAYAYAWRAQLNSSVTILLFGGIVLLTAIVVLFMWRQLARRREAWLESWIVVDGTGIEQHNGNGDFVRIDGTDTISTRESALWVVIQDSAGRSVVIPRFYGKRDIAEIRAATRDLNRRVGAGR